MESSNTVKRVLWGVAFALMAAAVIGNFLVSYGNTEMLKDGQKTSTHLTQVDGAIDDLLSRLKDAETGQRGYLLTDRKEYLEPYRSASRTVVRDLASLKELIATDSNQSHTLTKIEPLINDKLDELARTVGLLESGDREAALSIVQSGQGLHLMEQIRDGIQAMRAAQAGQEAENVAVVTRLYTFSQRRAVIGLVAGLLFVMFGIELLRRDARARDRATRDLFEQNEWFSTTLRSIGDGVIVTDIRGQVRLLNEVAEKMTGWNASDAIDKPLPEVFDIINETTRERVPNPVERALDEGRVVGLANHTVLRARGGSEHAIEDSAAPVRNAQGTIQGAVMVFHDSTQRRQSEIDLSHASEEIARRAQAAIASERILHTILDNAPIGISMTGPGPDYPIIVMSRQMHEWLGAGEGVSSHQLYRKLLPDGSVPAPERLPLYRAMRDGTVVRNEPWIVEARQRDRFSVIVNVAPVRDDAGTIIGAVHSWVDLTEQQRLDRALRLTESRLRVLERSDVIGLMLSFDRRGNVTQANAALLEMLEFSEADVATGKLNLVAQTPAGFDEVDAKAFEELEEYGSCTPYEKEFFCNGNTRRIAVVVAYAKVADQNDEYVGFALDLTERKKLEHQLRQQSERLLLADRRKDEFLAMLAHELRNPLAPLRNAVHLLSSEKRRDWNFVDKTIPAMRRQIDHLVRLVDDLLDAARISQNKIVLEKQIIELNPLLEAAIETIQPLIVAQKHQFNAILPTESIFVNGDSTRLIQAFANILHNAAKYTAPGGSIELRATKDKDRIVVSVQDNGQGIESDLLSRIFDPFTQADQSLARSAGGLGIGLALVRRLIELHEGTVIAFSSGSGKGSEFIVSLPMALPPVSVELPSATAVVTAAGKSPRRVLLVDDNRDLAASTAALLALWGHESKIIGNGKDAVAAALTFRPDLVLLDIGLPDLDGFEVAKLMRAEPRLADVRLIAMTGYAQQRDRMRTLESGFDAHLVKPVEPEVLRAVIEQA